MTAAVSNTTEDVGVLTGNDYDQSIVRATGEGFLVGVYYEYDFGAPSAISGATWDPPGDNQALTHLQTQQWGSDNRWLSVFALAAPTSAKTGTLRATFSGTTISRVSIFARHITGHDLAAMIESSAKAGGTMEISTPVSTDVSSSTGNLVVDFFGWRNEAVVLTAGTGQGDVETYEPVAGSRVLASSTKAGASTVAMGWSTNDVTAFGYAHVVVSVASATGGGSTPIAFAGTIPTLIYDEGDTVDEDLSSYFSGTETPFTYADIGADFSATGLSLNTSTGHLTGTATTASVSGCQIEGTDATPDTADSNTFTITVNAVDTTNPSATGTPTFSAVTKNSATVSFTAATDDTAVDGYEYRLDGGSAVDIGDVLTFDLSAQTPGATVTVEARAYDPAGNRGAWTGADVTFLIWGFDFDDEDLDLNLGNFSGTQVGLGLITSTNWTLSVQDPDTRAIVVEDVQTTDGTTAKFPRFADGALDSGTYLIVGQTTETDPADRMCFAILMDTTSA